MNYYLKNALKSIGVVVFLSPLFVLLLYADAFFILHGFYDSISILTAVTVIALIVCLVFTALEFLLLLYNVQEAICLLKEYIDYRRTMYGTN